MIGLGHGCHVGNHFGIFVDCVELHKILMDITENEFVFLALKEEETSGESLVYVASKAEWDDANTLVIAVYHAQEKDGKIIPMKHLLYEPVPEPNGNAQEKFIFHYPKWYKFIGPDFIFVGHKNRVGLKEV